jgi:DNA/RNA-binding domain of Phe-tRNA-synthetase-like protein
MGLGDSRVRVSIDKAVQERYPDLSVLCSSIADVIVEPDSEELRGLEKQILERLRSRYTLSSLKDNSVFRAYRDFFWRIGIDPTKIRPAGEALVRRVLRGKHIPMINTFVDAYNLASMETGIALAAFDRDWISGPMLLRFSKMGEEFLGIGMNSPYVLKGGEVVVSDRNGVLAVYPYRDAERSKIQFTTQSVVILACGVPGIDPDLLNQALSISIEYITKFCKNLENHEND